MIGFTILLFIIGLLGFVFYRYRQYQQQRTIELEAAQAQAFVSGEVVQLLQRFKRLQRHHTCTTASAEQLQLSINNLTEQLFCDTDSLASVRQYLSHAKQEIAIINHQLTLYEQGDSVHSTVHARDFDALK